MLVSAERPLRLCAPDPARDLVPDPLQEEKLAAAKAAVQRVGRKMLVALGTGSTAELAIHALAARFPDDGELTTVASSPASEAVAREAGLPVRELRSGDRFDVMIDGADEVNPALELTKGGGGALFREKLLARLTREVVIAVDHTKVVKRLGERFPIPVETVPFARPTLMERLTEEGYAPTRRTRGEAVWRTENGNEIIDLHLPQPLADVSAFDAFLRTLPGVVETGLFVGLAHRIFVGRSDGSVEEWSIPFRA
jgi:ribose 5-phosphate isomerase A